MSVVSPEIPPFKTFTEYRSQVASGSTPFLMSVVTSAFFSDNHIPSMLITAVFSATAKLSSQYSLLFSNHFIAINCLFIVYDTTEKISNYFNVVQLSVCQSTFLSVYVVERKSFDLFTHKHKRIRVVKKYRVAW